MDGQGSPELSVCDIVTFTTKFTQYKVTSLILTYQQGRFRNKAEIFKGRRQKKKKFLILSPDLCQGESNEPTPDLLRVDHFRDGIAAINQVIANKKIKLVRFTELSLMDDETYGAADELKPLPKC